MRQLKVLVVLDKRDFERLAELARADEREVNQQATYLLKQTLRQQGRAAERREVAAC